MTTISRGCDKPFKVLLHLLRCAQEIDDELICFGKIQIIVLCSCLCTHSLTEELAVKSESISIG
jgi:hypothetical protein